MLKSPTLFCFVLYMCVAEGGGGGGGAEGRGGAGKNPIFFLFFY